MGFGFPAAIGAKIGCPDEQVVCIAGDGSFQMNSQEMATASIHRVPVKVHILDNRCLGMVHQWQKLYYDERYSSTLLDASPDFVKLAEAYGWQGERYDAAVKGFEAEPEGGARCTVCFRLRLEETARLAAQLGYEYFCTTLSVSPHKDAERINRIGREMGEKYGVKWLPSDFKKREGYKRSIELSREFGLYRQDYCGCLYSKAGN